MILKSEKIFKHFKMLFEKAGKVRDLQLEEKLLKNEKNISSFSEYLNVLRVQRLKQRKRFFSMINEKEIENLKKTSVEIDSFIEGISGEKSNNYMRETGEKIISLLQNNSLKEKEAHQVRKLLKSFYYLLKSLDYAVDDLHLKTMRRFGEALGKWHDYRVVTRNLKKTLHKKSLTEKTKAHLESIVLKLETDSENLFKSVQVMINQN